jgi:hypothetical protein
VGLGGGRAGSDALRRTTGRGGRLTARSAQ